jgi:hypothetical protein
VPASTQEAFDHAQEVNQRKLIREAHQAEAAAEAAARSHNEPGPDACPPSPDDIAFLEKQRTRIANEPTPFSIGSIPIQAEPSASTIASSMDGYENSSVSQSMSNPSFGIGSNASSPPGEGYFAADYGRPHPGHSASGTDIEPEFMRTADTVTKHGRPRQVATGPALEDWQNRSYDDDQDADDDSDEEGMIMGPANRKL